MHTDYSLNHYSKPIPVKEALEKLSDISPKDSKKWLAQFGKLKKIVEYYTVERGAQC